MGEIADALISGEFDMYTGEYIGKAVGYPRSINSCHTQKLHVTPSIKKIKSIRKEIAIMVNKQGIKVDEARRLTNIKYGKGWRERGLITNSPDQWTEEELKDFK